MSKKKNRKIMKKNVIVICWLLSMFFVSFEYVSADAWWGEGYRAPAWVLSHGGTIINCTVVGTDHTRKYKAMMFRGGQYVEVEFGGKMKFDDAKNGTYVINFYKCDGSCADQKYDKKTKIRDKDKLITTISVVARPGQTINIIFDAVAQRAYIAGRSGRVDPFVAQRQAAKDHVGQYYTYTDVRQRDHRFDQIMYLAPTIDFSTFAQKNKDAGIIPQFGALEDGGATS
jgi:hypothetical protein